MRRALFKCALALGVAGLIGLAACKPTEANYRAAYERTVAGRSDDPDSTIYTQIRREFVPGTLTYAGRAFPTGSQFVAVTEGGGGISESIKRYCVVAGQFKQIFNAKSMRERLTEGGYPGAFVMQTREPYYFVVAGSSHDIEPAIEIFDKLQADTALRLREPAPFILLPAQIK